MPKNSAIEHVPAVSDGLPYRSATALNIDEAERHCTERSVAPAPEEHTDATFECAASPQHPQFSMSKCSGQAQCATTVEVRPTA
mmetsp:Transcript_35489/g.58795  ORF Transcript_35489/g.58795 Transcript_35489/m.58795 type:complete len:84 (-) Transcript_35489:228-479(-)|eukprot:CAMPEP_0119300482 /NCGR_PEP_ID=MMETSP1333-20130426/2413_1 /TAXON_ID=418940 /ORGANISM="Scyphosphaera apsteinii, Strain RCC1455" /LENGTH=83 /DNA_ID=CAMNT_0007302261 /DNA_START=362 /DNA_END=613 /DNA_ORIENTATION=+